jgi:hypothetical protein
MPERMSILGVLSPDPFSLLLGTGYERFESPTGLQGLARTSGKRLDLLAVNATEPGRGQFRAFIGQAKHEFETICVWEVWNPLLDLVLQRYGFRVRVEIDERTGDSLVGYRYDAGGEVR